MKKQILSLMLGVCMMSTALTGCGENKEVTKTDEAQVEIQDVPEQEVATEVATEAATETAPEELPLADETETAVEEEASDFLAENGIVITPQSQVKSIKVCERGTDDVYDMLASVTVTTTPSDEEGYSDTTAVYTFGGIDMTTAGDLGDKQSIVADYAMFVFDRYTGINFESGLEDFETGFDTGETGTHHTDVCVIDVDGTQYDCGASFSQETAEDGSIVWTVSVHHPSEYDGVVFAAGKNGAKQVEISSTIDWSQAFKMTDYPEVCIEDMILLTATDK